MKFVGQERKRGILSRVQPLESFLFNINADGKVYDASLFFFSLTCYDQVKKKMKKNRRRSRRRRPVKYTFDAVAYKIFINHLVAMCIVEDIVHVTHKIRFVIDRMLSILKVFNLTTWYGCMFVCEPESVRKFFYLKK